MNPYLFRSVVRHILILSCSWLVIAALPSAAFAKGDKEKKKGEVIVDVVVPPECPSDYEFGPREEPYYLPDSTDARYYEVDRTLKLISTERTKKPKIIYNYYDAAYAFKFANCTTLEGQVVTSSFTDSIRYTNPGYEIPGNACNDGIAIIFPWEPNQPVYGTCLWTDSNKVKYEVTDYRVFSRKNNAGADVYYVYSDVTPLAP